MANIVNFILLLPVYFIGVGLSAFLLKLKKEKPLDLNEKKESVSYWKAYNLGTKAKETYKRMF